MVLSKRDKEFMQAHKGVGGLPIGTFFLKIGKVVFEKNYICKKNENFL